MISHRELTADIRTGRRRRDRNSRRSRVGSNPGRTQSCRTQSFTGEDDRHTLSGSGYRTQISCYRIRVFVDSKWPTKGSGDDVDSNSSRDRWRCDIGLRVPCFGSNSVVPSKRCSGEVRIVETITVESIVRHDKSRQPGQVRRS